MIRYAKHNNRDYIVIDGTIQLDGEIVPMQVQVNIQNVKESERPKLYKIVGVAFNRNISFDRPPKKIKKPWWQIWG